MSAPEKKKTEKAVSYELPASWANAWKIAAGIGIVGLAGAGVAMSSDPRRFAFSYLTAFVTFLTIALGALFFILIQHLTSAGWSVTMRRTAEFMAMGLPVFAVLFIPIVLQMGNLFPWTHVEPEHEHAAQHGPEHVGMLTLEREAFAQDAPPPVRTPDHRPPILQGPNGPRPHGRPPMGGPGGPGDHGEHGMRPGMAPGRGGPDPNEVEEHEVLEGKSAYLNKQFFLVRAAIYFIVWGFLGFIFFKLSTNQDVTKDPQNTVRAQRVAPLATVLFAWSITFAAFDWIMSLLPQWFSTIFGVNIFAAAVISGFSVLILVTLYLRESGPLKNVITPEHYHDIGKLLFGFLVFWAYISFSQFMLIWYAALPEETTFYHLRWDHGPWATFSVVMMVGQFILPFFFLISRVPKRRLELLKIGAAWVAIMHFVDMYWFVMPNFGQEGFSVSWIDFTCLIGVGGAYFAVVLYRMTKHPLIPIGDPRLARSIAFVNA